MNSISGIKLASMYSTNSTSNVKSVRTEDLSAAEQELNQISNSKQAQDEDSELEIQEAAAATTATGTSTQLSNSEKEEIEEQIRELEEKREKNNEKIEKYNELIEKEKEKISNSTSEAECLSQKNKEAAQKASKNVIQEYKDGKISKENVKTAIRDRINDAIDVLGLNQLESDISTSSATINGYEAEKAAVASENEEIEGELEDLYERLEEADATETTVDTTETTVETTSTSSADTSEEEEQTEPQGFQVKNADGSTTQYDFFVDRDGNKALSDATEFLGAKADAAGKDGYTEMQAYDANGDGKITYDEFKQGNANNVNNGELMVMVTTINADGTKTQEAKTLEEAFGTDSDLTIDAQKNAVINNNVGPYGFNNSQYNNDMLGNFNVKLNGQNITGYQTDDDINYLNAYYKFTSGSATATTTNATNSSGTNTAINSNLSALNAFNGLNGYVINNQATWKGSEDLKNIMNDLYSGVNATTKAAIAEADKSKVQNSSSGNNDNSKDGKNEDNKEKRKQNFYFAI